MTKLIAFHGDKKIKEKYLLRLKAHHKADEIIQGTGYSFGRGCAVGCTLNKYDHKAYETELGVPQSLAKLEDKIFESLQATEAPTFAVQFLSSIQPGADLNCVAPAFVVWLMQDILDRPRKKELPVYVKESILLVQGLCKRDATGDKVSRTDWTAARDKTRKSRRDAADAYADAYAAYAAANAAAYAAAAAAAAYAAAYAAADAAADAAAADAAAYAAADAADAAADAAYRKARQEFWRRAADQLLSLLASAPVPAVEVENVL